MEFLPQAEALGLHVLDARPVISWSRRRPRQLIQQRFSLLQDRCIETFCKPAVDRREQITSFRMPALVAPEPGEAYASAQLRELRALPLGNSDGLVIALFSAGSISGDVREGAGCLIQPLGFKYPLVGSLDNLCRFGEIIPGFGMPPQHGGNIGEPREQDRQALHGSGGAQLSQYLGEQRER